MGEGGAPLLVPLPVLLLLLAVRSTTTATSTRSLEVLISVSRPTAATLLNSATVKWSDTRTCASTARPPSR